MSFLHNLSSDTYRSLEIGHMAPDGYLIAPQNARGRLLKLTSQVADSRRLLLLDNGNFTSIGKIRSEFLADSRRLGSEVREVENTLGRSVRRGELPAHLVSKFDHLDRQIRAEALARNLPDDEMLSMQLHLHPDRVIGAEDLTMAAWLSLDVESRYTSRPRGDFRRYNQSVARRALRVYSGLDGIHLNDYFPVASAVSYNTAFDAGREFAEAGIESVAMGFGAYMADANYVDHAMIERKRINFGMRLPYRYIRTILVINGFLDGYRRIANRQPKRFHFLGLGAPIMLPPVALAAGTDTELTFDATSPIKDATRGGTLYVDKPALLKVRTRKVAYRLSRESEHRWDCPCPFCEAFVTTYPFDYELGHSWFKKAARLKVTAKDLRTGGALFPAYPLLSEPSGGELRRAVNYTRTGHNHWILERTMTSLERAASRDGLRTRVNNIIGEYQKNTSSPFANALQLAIDLAKSNQAPTRYRSRNSF